MVKLKNTSTLSAAQKGCMYLASLLRSQMHKRKDPFAQKYYKMKKICAIHETHIMLTISYKFDYFNDVKRSLRGLRI